MGHRHRIARLFVTAIGLTALAAGGCKKEEAPTAAPPAAAAAPAKAKKGHVAKASAATTTEASPGMASIAGKWRIGKTATATLHADGTLKSSVKSLNKGTWTLAPDTTVTLMSPGGEVGYTFKVDATGTPSRGTWKDGATAAPEKISD